MMNLNVTALRAWLIGASFLLIVPTSLAQSGLAVSKNADFATEDRRFEPGETVYVRVTAPEIDNTDIDNNEVLLRPTGRDGGFEGTLQNNFDGTYAGRFGLPTGDEAFGEWLLEIRLSDKLGHAFETRLFIAVGATVQDQKFEIEGEVTELGDDFISVAGRKVVVSTTTEIIDADGHPIGLGNIQAGDRVHVSGVVREDVPVALRIKLLGSDDHVIEFTGLIDEIRDRAIVMLGRVLYLTEQTEILNAEGKEIPFSSLEVGMMAAARARIDGDRILLLRLKVRASHMREFEVDGTVTEILDRGFSLDGHLIAVTSETEFVGREGQLLEFSDLSVGDLVHVVGTVGGDLVPVAKRVKILEKPGPRKFELDGFIREIGDNALAVAGVKILVTEDTKILDLHNEPIAFTQLEVGDYVHVTGVVRDDGTPVARSIEIEEPERQEITVAGEVQRKGERVLVVKEISFEVTEDTEIVDEMGDPFPFAQIEIGMFVRVKGLLFDRSHEARALKIEVRTRRYVHLTGTIKEIGGDAISVSGIRVFVNNSTTIVGSNGERLELADLHVGQIVKVEGWKVDGGVAAKTIVVRVRVEDEVLVAGILEAREDSSVVILGVHFRILAGTTILDFDGNEMAFERLEVGRPVRLRGKLLGDGTLVALKIREMDRAVRGINVVGPIESVGDGTIEVIGIHFFVNDETRILGTSGESMRLEDLEVGQTVALQGMGRPDGTRLALRIRLLDVLVAMGEVDALANDHVSILGMDFPTDTDLLVLHDGVRRASLQASDLRGIVEIRAASDEAGQMRVSRITLHEDGASSTVEVDAGGEVPARFHLGQAYPNPFNPSTTIMLEVLDAGPIELAVYNVLGQRLATLSDQVLTPGTYTFEWNGRDTSGAPAASGLYLYRAAVGRTVQTRTMTLIK